MLFDTLSLNNKKIILVLEFHFDFPANSCFLFLFVFFERVDYICIDNSFVLYVFPERGGTFLFRLDGYGLLSRVWFSGS